LGKAGEIWVIELEKRRLRLADRTALAEKVKHTAEVDGDGLGYDIQSFDANGHPLFIEVKATNLGVNTPFFISERELAVSRFKGEQYKLYRVFSLSDKPLVYVLSGPLRDKLRLSARMYSARPQ
jgi:hypothetical protein